MSEPAPDHAALIARLRTLAAKIQRDNKGNVWPVNIMEAAKDAAACHEAADALAALRGATPAGWQAREHVMPSNGDHAFIAVARGGPAVRFATFYRERGWQDSNGFWVRHLDITHFIPVRLPAPPEATPAGWQHGVSCRKVQHGSDGGYLHGPDDDRPYDVDGVTYCGRCHAWIESPAPPEATE